MWGRRIEGREDVLVALFETPANLVPKVDSTINYVAVRDDGLNRGRQDNRGYEGLAISPDGKKLFAILQDPRAGSGTDPRQGRNIGVSAIVALNATEFLILERDNRGIGVEHPTGVPGTRSPFRPMSPM
jgi:hypothetical protein